MRATSNYRPRMLAWGVEQTCLVQNKHADWRGWAQSLNLDKVLPLGKAYEASESLGQALTHKAVNMKKRVKKTRSCGVTQHPSAVLWFAAVRLLGTPPLTHNNPIRVGWWGVDDGGTISSLISSSGKACNSNVNKLITNYERCCEG